MPDNPNPQNASHKDKTNKSENAFAPPSISLPKGGGAIRGIGEKFAANPVTGTGSMMVPIATSPGRSGFGPQLSLSYDSGAGNGPFGFGWNLSLPSITRKTDKGLPQYLDAEESDVFILSGAEDLVPVLVQNGQDAWELETLPPRTVDGKAYSIQRYRPRIEGLFARIERWANETDPKDTFWRSISKDNITTWYGRTEKSRIADPANPTRIFSWLICESYDDKGNVITYEYKAEDGERIFENRPEQDVSLAHEANRTDETRSANRYLKRIHYGNQTSRLTKPDLSQMSWLFEVVFDYGEHDKDTPSPNDNPNQSNSKPWPCRNDPFSSYRAGFEVRTYRLCQRMLMFHHFEGEEGIGNNCLVRSTDFTYSYEQDPNHARNPVYTFLREVTQSGYKRDGDGYLKRSLPPLEFEYTQPVVQGTVEEVDAECLENLPIGLDGATYQWTDLHGEGIPGILTEQGDAWFYKRNLSPINGKPKNGAARTEAKFAPLELVASKPNLALAGGAQFMDLAGDGQPDLVVLDGPTPGLYEHDGDEGWQPFRPFTSRLNRDTRDPNLKLVDLNGDGHADVLITENDAFVWHPSLTEEGFGPARRVAQALDEEKGPRLVFADGTQSIYLADLSGDGLTDLARIRNGEVCYWPNLGYGRFGAKVTMDHSPHFDNPDQFDQKRVRLADIDGSGTTDIIYLHRDGVRLYFNQSGNSWSKQHILSVFPRVDELTSITTADLLGSGTACLVWSSPLPGDARRPMRYINLMGDQKPHLLIKATNNLGAETHVQYAPSTKFYLKDKYAGKPWFTRLPFPVHVVEHVETYDRISRNRFVTRYAYHHGYFDGEEREFRGFGMVEQWDTEVITALGQSNAFPVGDNIAAASHIPPVHTKTWFHTGVYLDRDHVSDFFAGLLDTQDRGEYYREPGLTNDQARALLLPDTVLPAGLSLDEEREACRALKGAMLRQEVYALDGTSKEEYPYTIAEQNFTIKCLQPRGENHHAVFFTHAREAITFHYERNLDDPRIQHALTLEVDPFGNVLKSAAIGYGRRMDAPDPALLPEDHEKQRLIHLTCTENTFTNPIVDSADVYRTPLPAEMCTYEVRKPQQEKSSDGLTNLYQFDAVLTHLNQAGDGNHDIAYEDIHFDQAKQAAANDANENNRYFRRLIEQVRTLYRPDDLGAAQDDPNALLPLGEVEPLALPGESYKLAFTSGLLDQVYVRSGQQLLPVNPADVLAGGGADLGGYVDLDGDGHWWIPAGRVFYSDDPTHTAAQELGEATAHFLLPRRYRDPFGQDAFVDFDPNDLLMVETRDALDNRVTVNTNDYRVLQPRLVSDPNRNQTEVAFDTLGMVVGTAVMGKPQPAPVEGDTLTGFVADLPQAQFDAFLDAADPHATAPALLQSATTRIIYDLDRFRRTQQANPNDPTQWQPACAATLARETHASAALPPQGLKVQLSFSYSDGFDREIQKKIQAEPGPVAENGPVVAPRWVGSGWTIFNNKGKPVRQYEPFFSATHGYEFNAIHGVSPVLFYDPAERVIATLHPNHTYEKVVFDPWQQTTYDVNDTCAARNAETGDPRTDPDVSGYVENYFKALPVDPTKPWQAWHAQRSGGALGPHEQAAATRAAAHADTPTIAHFDTLGRPFLTIAKNKVVCPDHNLDGSEEDYHTRVELDIEGNQRAVIDAKGRVVMRYTYTMVGPEKDENGEPTNANLIHQASMEAGERWTLNDVTGKPIRAWDNRGHNFTTAYDALRRPVEQYVRGTFSDSDPLKPNSDPRTLNRDILIDKIEYGEAIANAEALNLRTRIYLHSDSAGISTNARLDANDNPTEAYDFKGNLLYSSRKLAQDYRVIPDWSRSVKLDDETFQTSTTYDALNRPTTLTSPDNSVIRPTYNEANLLDKIDVNLHGAAVTTPFVTNIDYDAKGQRLQIDYGNSASTYYDYDPFTFRLIHLRAERKNSSFPDDCPDPPPTGWPGCQVQNLHYTYDPAGNINHIRDDAQQTIYFKNKRVEPSAEYTYDAVYRLIEATGREHLGPNGGAPIPHSYNDARRIGRPHPNDDNAMGRYCEKYVYDEVGNFSEMSHHTACNTSASWTRTYAYIEKSLIEDGENGMPLKYSNRLSSTIIGNGNPITEKYSYDVHGNMIQMPHLPLMGWNYKDELQKTSRQDVQDSGCTPETTYYVYDAAGQRVRKVTERHAPPGHTPTRREERIYLGGFEIYRKYEADGSTRKLERETLHIMDDKQRIALVETRTKGNDPAPKQLIRYQFGNHLGSASLEMDDTAQIISYEEYTPYGSTSYQMVGKNIKATAKRYRYTGKERDEESGLYYYGARYYAPWLGRWCKCDPIGIYDGANVYAYVHDNPIRLNDPSGTKALKPKIRPAKKRTLASYRGLKKMRLQKTSLERKISGLENLNSRSNILDIKLSRLKGKLQNTLQQITTQEKRFVKSMENLFSAVDSNRSDKIQVEFTQKLFFDFLKLKGYINRGETFERDIYENGCVGITQVITDKSFDELVKAATSKNLSSLPSGSHRYAILLHDSQLWGKAHKGHQWRKTKKANESESPQEIHDRLEYNAKYGPDDYKESGSKVDIRGWDYNAPGIIFDFGYFISDNVILHANHKHDPGGKLGPMTVYVSNQKNFSGRPTGVTLRERKFYGCNKNNPCKGYLDYNQVVYGST